MTGTVVTLRPTASSVERAAASEGLNPEQRFALILAASGNRTMDATACTADELRRAWWMLQHLDAHPEWTTPADHHPSAEPAVPPPGDGARKHAVRPTDIHRLGAAKGLDEADRRALIANVTNGRTLSARDCSDVELLKAWGLLRTIDEGRRPAWVDRMRSLVDHPAAPHGGAA